MNKLIISLGICTKEMALEIEGLALKMKTPELPQHLKPIIGTQSFWERNPNTNDYAVFINRN
jgi:hypothetical protein